MIRLKYATVTRTDYGCKNELADGTFVDSIPHPGDHHYHVIAHRLGYGDDLHAYCFEHDVCHWFVAEYLFDLPSPALHGVAHGREVPSHEAAYEEMSVQQFQRWLRANERPIIGGVDWDAMKAAASRLLSLPATEPRTPQYSD